MNGYQKLAQQYEHQEITKEQYIGYCKKLDIQLLNSRRTHYQCSVTHGKAVHDCMSIAAMQKLFEDGAINPRTGI